MATTAELELLIRARDEASAAVNKLSDAVRKAGGESATAAGPLGSLGDLIGSKLVLSAAGAATAVVAVGAALVSFGRQAAEEQVGIESMAAALEAQGTSFKANEGAIDAQINKLQGLAIADDDVRASIQTLAEHGESLSNIFEDQAVAADLARAKGISLQQASELLGRAFEGSTGQLTRMGIHLQEGATRTEILAEIQKRFAGQAEAYAGTAAGAWERFNQQIANVQEDIGAGLLPAMTELGTALGDVVTSLRDAGVFDALGAAIGDVVVPAVHQFAEGIRDVSTSVRTVIEYLSGAVDGVQALAAAMGGDAATAAAEYASAQDHLAEAAKIQAERTAAAAKAALELVPAHKEVAASAESAAVAQGKVATSSKDVADAVAREHPTLAGLNDQHWLLVASTTALKNATDAARSVLDLFGVSAAGVAPALSQADIAANALQHTLSRTVEIPFGGFLEKITQAGLAINQQARDMAPAIEANSEAWRKAQAAADKAASDAAAAAAKADADAAAAAQKAADAAARAADEAAAAAQAMLEMQGAAFAAAHGAGQLGTDLQHLTDGTHSAAFASQTLNEALRLLPPEVRNQITVHSDLTLSLEHVQKEYLDLARVVANAVNAMTAEERAKLGLSIDAWNSWADAIEAATKRATAAELAHQGIGESLAVAPREQFGIQYPNYLGRASGGPVSAGTPYWVGEEGPEVFVPGASGTILPTGSWGGATAVYVSISGNTVRSDADLERLAALAAAKVSEQMRRDLRAAASQGGRGTGASERR